MNRPNAGGQERFSGHILPRHSFFGSIADPDASVFLEDVDVASLLRDASTDRVFYQPRSDNFVRTFLRESTYRVQSGCERRTPSTWGLTNIVTVVT